MLGLSSIANHALAALRFKDEVTFRQAARLAVDKQIPVDAPGRNTLIIRTQDIEVFMNIGLKFDLEDVPETRKVSDAERAALRRRLR